MNAKSRAEKRVDIICSTAHKLFELATFFHCADTAFALHAIKAKADNVLETEYYCNMDDHNVPDHIGTSYTNNIS